MKPTFHHKLLNGPFEDPCLYVRLLWERRGLLFDLGVLSRLGPAEMQKITDIFVTHTHIDHFIGFDTVLRALLRRELPLRIFGPPTITDCIEGKLGGYTWNLIKEYPLCLEVFAIDGQNITSTSFHARESFKRVDRQSMPFEGVCLGEPSFKVKAVMLSHDIPCLGFCLEEDIHINIDKARLTDMALPVGPWLSSLKKAIREGLPDDTPFEVEGKSFTLSKLKEIAYITKGQKISYIADTSPDDANLERIIPFVRDSDTLYCEAYFLDADMERAVERNHLTAKLAGKIAREAGVKNLTVMHFSPKYKTTPDAPEKEAMEEFLRG
jgi:ribonuclease Z